MTKRLAFLVLLVLLHWNAQGQKYSIKDFNLEGDIDAWFSARFDSVNIKPIIGPLVLVAPPRPSTNAFFAEKQRDWLNASLMYDNQFYKSIRLKYDIEQQLVYTPHPDNLQPVGLDQKLVNWFQTSLGVFKPREDGKGYYLIIYNGEHLNLTKESSKRLIIDDRVFEYARTDEVYLLMDNDKTRIRKAKSFLKLFPSHKKEIKKYMRSKASREIKRENKENYLVHIAQYCDNLDGR